MYKREVVQGIDGEIQAAIDSLELGAVGHVVSFFGGSRLREEDAHYQAARKSAKALAEMGFAIMTGGGPGIMQAANHGAKDGGGLSIGLNIRLPHEQVANPHIDLLIEFEHFAARKSIFSLCSEAFVVFPGGFGTLDELFEILTLITTGKRVKAPILLYDQAYWIGLYGWIEREMVGSGALTQSELESLIFFDTPELLCAYLKELRNT